VVVASLQEGGRVEVFIAEIVVDDGNASLASDPLIGLDLVVSGIP
jgi:hypothetical protein